MCRECRVQVEAKLVDEKPDASRLATALVGGVTGAILGGALWAAIVLITNYEVGYVALAVGALAGYGTLLGAGGKKSGALQGISVLAAVLGLVLGKYFTVAHMLIHKTEEFAGRSYLDSEIIQLFVNNVTEFVSGFDFLWLFLALGIAFKVLAPTKVSMSRKK